MEKEVPDKHIEGYFYEYYCNDCFHEVIEFTPGKFLPKIFNPLYNPPMSKEEFFADRPWLEKDDKLYEEYIQEDVKQKNEAIAEKRRWFSKYNDRKMVEVFYLKKNS
jgi:hypothetical protein